MSEPPDTEPDFEVGRYGLRSFKLHTDRYYLGWPRHGVDREVDEALRANPNISYGELNRIAERAQARNRLERLIEVSDGIRVGPQTVLNSYWGSPSFGSGADWRDGTCVAVCKAYRGPLDEGRHDAPKKGCKCGIYASLSYGDLLAQFREYTTHMVAVIATAGNTIIGDRGLRTQYAKVVAYWTDPDPLRRKMAFVQFRDAKPFDSPLEMIEAYGLALLPVLPVPKDIRYHGPEWWTGS